MQTRRKFLTTSAATAAALSFGMRPLSALSRAELVAAPEIFFPQPAEPERLATLAQQVVDHAVQAGANYADIRLGEVQHLGVRLGLVATEADVWIGAERHYGIRVLVDGVWGFASGATLTAEQLTNAANRAVAHAKHRSQAQGADDVQRVTLATVAAQTGTWSSPVQIDPFTVPIAAQRELLGASNAAMERVIGVSASGSGSRVTWERHTRVVASSSGTLLTQLATRARPEIIVNMIPMPNFGEVSAGFEAMLAPQMIERTKAFADDVVYWQSFPVTSSLDVGRFPVVMDGRAAAAQVKVLAQACEADRALGYEGDADGTSFLAPVPDMLRAKELQFSPHVTLEAIPTERSSKSWRWDAEGVELTPYLIIKNGRVVEYIATRETAAAAAIPALRGGLLVETPDQLPMTAAAEVTLESGSETASEEDLIRDVDGEGIFVKWEQGVLADPGLHTALCTGAFYHIKKGHIIGQIPSLALMVRPPKLWKEHLVIRGDTSTTQVVLSQSSKGMPWQNYEQLITSPALLFKDVDVIRLGGTVQ